jgi:surface protein
MEPRVYVAENGITIKCEGCEPGYRTVLDGREILVVDDLLIREVVHDLRYGMSLVYLCTSMVSDMNRLFSRKNFFDEDISHWDTSNVNNMAYMFSNSKFNRPLDVWDTSKVVDMSGMFYCCKYFNQPLANWSVKNVKTMEYMFSEAISFNQPIGNWDVSNVQNMRAVFFEARSFNQPLHKWNIRSVSDMGFMFHGSACSPKEVMNYWNLSHLESEQKEYMFKPETIEWEYEKRRWKIAGLLFLIFWLFSFIMTLDK